MNDLQKEELKLRLRAFKYGCWAYKYHLVSESELDREESGIIEFMENICRDCQVK